jgi:hypothetical protein
MSTQFVSDGAWTQITRAVRTSKRPCLCAVAYFGEKSSSRLPLPKGSILVVNASERCVKSGSTCPAELLRLLNRGVRIYSAEKLHAKVFVTGRRAWVGSTNVSDRSETKLIEAAIVTTESVTVEAARRFVRAQCIAPLGPESLKQLQKLYQRSQVPGGNKDASRSTSTSSRYRIIQLEHDSWTSVQTHLHDEGQAQASGKLERPRAWEQDSFVSYDPTTIRPDEMIVFVTRVPQGKRLVDAPARVYEVMPAMVDGERMWFVYVERPKRRRRVLASVARQAGCTQKSLLHNGPLANHLGRTLQAVFSIG